MLTIITTIFSSAKMWIGIGILALVLAGYGYVHHIQAELALSQANLKTEVANETLLKNQVGELQTAQAQAALVIAQVTKDKADALVAVDALNTSLNASVTQYDVLKAQQNKITAKPVAVSSPYINQAIQAVQARRASRGVQQ